MKRDFHHEKWKQVKTRKILGLGSVLDSLIMTDISYMLTKVLLRKFKGAAKSFENI